MTSPLFRASSMAVILALSTILALTHGLTPIKRDQVDRVVRQVMRCGKIPALALSVVNLEDRSLYVNAYGTADPGSNTRANIDTRFCLGGATEAFTAVLLAKLIHENGNVTWSTPIQDIIGKRVILPDSYRSANLNLMDILSERSGLPGMDIVSITNPFTARRLVRNLRYVQPAAGFREQYVPNHVLFSLMDEVFQVLGGDSWENLLKNHILAPLDMNSVMVLGPKVPTDASNVAYPVVFFDGKPQSLSLESLKGLGLIQPAAGLCLSASDMSKWIRFILNGKGPNSDQIIAPEALEQTFRGVQPRGHSDDPEITGYRQPEVQVSYSREQNALGWIAGHYRGYQFVSQDGSIPGYQSLSTILPSRNVAVFASFTGDGGSKALAAKVLLNLYSIDILMRGNTWFNDADVCNLMDQMRDMKTDEPEPQHTGVVRTNKYMGERSLDEYIGYYRSYAYGDVFVRHNETEDLDLLLEYGQAVYKLSPTNTNDTFQMIAKGLLWYTTNADMYRDNKLIAVFSEDGRDPDRERRVTRLTISGFDRHDDVVFDTNPITPRFEMSHDGEGAYCDASKISSVSLVALLVMSVALLFR